MNYSLRQIGDFIRGTLGMSSEGSRDTGESFQAFLDCLVKQVKVKMRTENPNFPDLDPILHSLNYQRPGSRPVALVTTNI